MNKLLIILTYTLLASCIDSPVEETGKDEVVLLRLWSFEHGTAGDAPPVIHDDKIIMSGGLFVYALNEETGEEIWKYKFEEDNVLQGEIFLINGNQIAVAHTDKLRAWNISDGVLEWEFDYDINELKPRLTGNHVSFDNVYALTSEQSKFFILNKAGDVQIVKSLDNEFGVQGLTYYDNKIYAGQKKTETGALTLGRITALNTQTSRQLIAYQPWHLREN